MRIAIPEHSTILLFLLDETHPLYVKELTLYVHEPRFVQPLPQSGQMEK